MKKYFLLVFLFGLLLCAIMSPRTTFAADAMVLSWNSMGPGFQYSLDVITKDGTHIGPCINAKTIQSKTSVTFTGVCTSARNKSVPLSSVDSFTLIYTNTGDWVHDAHNTKIKNDPTVSSLTFALPVPTGAMQLNWNSLGAGYQYSLDVITKDGTRIGPCIPATVIGSATNVIYAGTCLNGAKNVVPLSNIASFSMVYTNNGDWKNNAHSVKIANNPAVSSLTLNLTLLCNLNGMVVNDGSTRTLYTQAFSTQALSCTAAQVTVSCKAGVLSKPSGSLYSSCTDIATTPLPTTSGGAPVIIERPDGVLIAAYNRTANKVASIDTYISNDKGATWSYLSNILSVPMVSGTSLSIANAFLRQLSDGRIIAAYRYHNGPTVSDTTSFKTFRLQSKISTDGGVTWGNAATIEQIDYPQSSSVGIWEPYIIEKPDKTLQVYYAKELSQSCASNGTPQDVIMRQSTNGGVSWSGPTTALHRGVSREGVPAVVQTSDGTMFITFETWRDSTCNASNPHIVPGLAMSTNGGESWQYLPDIYTGEPTSVGSGWPDMIRLKDGRLLMRFTLGSGGSSPSVALMVTNNVPSKTVIPEWRMVTGSGISTTSIGKMVQLSSGEIMNTNTASGATPVLVNKIPLSVLSAPVVTIVTPPARATMLASLYTALQQLMVLFPFLK